MKENTKVRKMLDYYLNRMVTVFFRDGSQVKGVLFDFSAASPYVIVLKKLDGKYVLCNLSSVTYMEVEVR